MRKEKYVVYKDYSFESPDVSSEVFDTPELAYGWACENAAHDAAVSSLESAGAPCDCGIVAKGSPLSVTLIYGDGETCLYSVMTEEEANARLEQETQPAATPTWARSCSLTANGVPVDDPSIRKYDVTFVLRSAAENGVDYTYECRVTAHNIAEAEEIARGNHNMGGYSYAHVEEVND